MATTPVAPMRQLAVEPTPARSGCIDTAPDREAYRAQPHENPIEPESRGNPGDSEPPPEDAIGPRSKRIGPIATMVTQSKLGIGTEGQLALAHPETEPRMPSGLRALPLPAALTPGASAGTRRAWDQARGVASWTSRKFSRSSTSIQAPRPSSRKPTRCTSCGSPTMRKPSSRGWDRGYAASPPTASPAARVCRSPRCPSSRSSGCSGSASMRSTSRPRRARACASPTPRTC
jgi:hypothetical protein